MPARLKIYGSDSQTHNAAKVGKGKTPASLAERMPSPDIAAKVGLKNPVTVSLAARMPSAEIAAKVGIIRQLSGQRVRRLVRRAN